MGKFKIIFSLFVALCLSMGVAVANNDNDINQAMKRHAGLYLFDVNNPFPGAAPEYSVVIDLDADGGCMIQANNFSNDPVLPGFEQAFAYGFCKWEIGVVNNDGSALFSLNLLLPSRDPSNLLFTDGSCSIACYVYAFMNGTVNDQALIIENETLAFMDRGLIPITSVLGPYLVFPDPQIHLKWTRAKARNNLENIGAPVPDIPGEDDDSSS